MIYSSGMHIFMDVNGTVNHVNKKTPSEEKEHEGWRDLSLLRASVRKENATCLFLFAAGCGLEWCGISEISEVADCWIQGCRWQHPFFLALWGWEVGCAWAHSVGAHGSWDSSEDASLEHWGGGSSIKSYRNVICNLKPSCSFGPTCSTWESGPSLSVLFNRSC